MAVKDDGLAKVKNSRMAPSRSGAVGEREEMSGWKIARASA